MTVLLFYDILIFGENMNYDFKINDFEGPLDLLLHLIKVNEMNIMDIKIEEITNQYIDFINKMESLNIDVASEYLVMASELIEIKSRLLLPKEKLDVDNEEEVDPKEELIKKLLEYDAYKKITEVLGEKQKNRSNIYTKLPENISNYSEEVDLKNSMDIDSLVYAFKLFLDRKNKSKPLITKLTVKEIIVSKRCSDIRNVFKTKKKFSFFELFDINQKDYIVATFLAILEMCKNNELNILQEDNFGDIILESVK